MVYGDERGYVALNYADITTRDDIQRGYRIFDHYRRNGV
jgi:hypothetical protein